MAEAVADLLDDLTIRHLFEECTDIPENHEYTVKFELARDHRRAYEVLKEHAVLELKEGGVTAFNSAVVANKLLQLSASLNYITLDAMNWYLISPTSETSVWLHLTGDTNVITLRSSQNSEDLRMELSTVAFLLENVQKSLNSSRRASCVSSLHTPHQQDMDLR
jgi:hypothetical protein